jgi:hypothetical protein
MIIEVDEYKKKIVGYDPNNSEDFHIESAKLADRDFYLHLKDPKIKEVIFMAGGVASGKSEYVAQFLRNREECLIYDGTLKNIEGFSIKYKEIKKIKKNVSISLVIPENWNDALDAFYGRERQMSVENFWLTHLKTKITVADVVESFPDVKINLYISTYVDKKISFKETIIDENTRDLLVVALRNLSNSLSIEFELYKDKTK